MFGKEFGDHVGTECVRDSAVAGRPALDVGRRVGPEEVAGETMVGDLLWWGGRGMGKKFDGWEGGNVKYGGRHLRQRDE